MSFVGPRPERPEFDAEFKNQLSFYMFRYLVKPGITGWAQVNYGYGASLEDALEKLKYDLYYVKNTSFLLDTEIFLKTAATVFLAKGR
ncbi:MAG: sugar transferase, partial [Holophagae bacterium]|nr:sugar transferase [Holophagae bacterium]